MGKKDNVEFANFGVGEPASPSAPVSRRQIVFLDGWARIALYRTLAAFLEAGVSLEEAGKVLIDEYKASGRTKNVKACDKFLKGLSAGHAGGPLLDTAFGKGFANAEETALLRCFHTSNSPWVLLRAAADMIEFDLTHVDGKVLQAVSQ